MKHPRLVIDIVTLFPGIVRPALKESMLKVAQAKGLVDIKVCALRRFGETKHKSCDDKPFGGGPGMVMMAGPLFKCVESIKKSRGEGHVVFLSPDGKRFDQRHAERLSKKRHLIFICGRYEGIDERVREHLVDEEISIGDFVMTGGEIPALCVVDAVTRLVAGVLGNQDSLECESFRGGLLDHPQYTRPRVFRGYKVPDVLFSGNHKKVLEWRTKKAFERTCARRPDLLRGRVAR